MLKHMSRSDSRNSFTGELSDSRIDELENTQGEIHGNAFGSSEVTSTDNNNVDGISILLTKPTIKKIIERRKSELFLKENLPETVKERKEEKSKEFIEEVEQNNSKIFIHRRKREPSSDTSSESGIASQVSEKKDSSSEGGQRDYWKGDCDFLPPPPVDSLPPPPGDCDFLPPPPVGFSSPKFRGKQKARSIHMSEEYLNCKENKFSRPPPPDELYGYCTLDGKVRTKNRPMESQRLLHSNLAYPTEHLTPEKAHETTPMRNSSNQLDPIRERNTHVGQSLTLDRRHARRYTNDVPTAPRYDRPHSVGPDVMQRYNSSNGFGYGCHSLPRTHKQSSSNFGNFNRNDGHRSSAYSISASSSVSNFPPLPPTPRSIGLGSSVSKYAPASSHDCSCGTLSHKRGLLEKINEEGEAPSGVFIESKTKRTGVCQRRCKHFTIFMIILAVIACVIGGLLHFYVNNYPQELKLNQGDVQVIDSTSLFCSGIEALSDETSVRVIAFDLQSEKKLMQYFRSENLVIEPLAVWKRSFHLLKGSTLKVKIKTDKSMDLMNFVSERKYNIWYERKQSETYSEKMICCSNKPDQTGEMTIDADHDADYILVVYSSEELFPVTVNIEIVFRRYTYDFTATSDSCTAEKTDSCKVEYGFNADSRVALEVPLDRQKANKIAKSAKIEWQCKARIWFYFVVFTSAFIVITLMLIISYFVFVKFVLPSQRCCCIANEKRKYKLDNIEYYDNYGRTNSDIATAENMYDTSSNRLSSSIPSSGTFLLKPLHDNNSSRINDSSQYLTNLFDSKASTMPRTSSAVSRSNNVAAIYNEAPPFIDTADSGISVEANFSSNGQQGMNAREMLQMKELQFQRLRSLRHHQLHGVEINDGRRMKELMNRPHSTQPGWNNHNDFDNRQSQSRRFNSTNELNFEHSHGMERSQRRPYSALPESEYFKYRNMNRLDEVERDLIYDDREVYI